MRQRITLTALILLALVSMGQRYDPLHTSTEVTGGLETAATLAASRSVTIDNNELRGYGILTLYVTITDSDNLEVGVAVSCTFEAVADGNSYAVPVCTWDDVNARYSCEPTADRPSFWNPSDETSPKRMAFRYDVEGADNGVCTFAFTTGSVDDTIAVRAYVAVKG